MRIYISVRVILSLFVITQIASCSDNGNDSSVATSRITAIVPDSGTAGRDIVIASNLGFNSSDPNLMVKFNGVQATIIKKAVSQIIARVPAGAGTGKVVVTSNGKEIEGPVFNFLEVPVTKYLMSFKSGGVLVDGLESTDQPKSNCWEFQCSCGYYALPRNSPDTYYSLAICNSKTFTSAEIANLVGKPLLFKVSDSNSGPSSIPIATFNRYEKNQQEFGSDRNLTSAFTLKISSASYHSSENGEDFYDISGTFECDIVNYDGAVRHITEGKFVVPITAQTKIL